ncbi:MAG: rhodanese-like domain-containing protein [Propylenella sp.]
MTPENVLPLLLLALGLLAAVVFFLRRGRGPQSGGEPAWIEANELAAKLNTGAGSVIDVRGPDEFTGELGHIANASNLPVGELAGRLTEINALKEGPVILVCRTDKRSANASAILRDAGFQDVSVLRGGMVEWNRSGLPVEGRNAA